MGRLFAAGGSKGKQVPVGLRLVVACDREVEAEEDAAAAAAAAPIASSINSVLATVDHRARWQRAVLEPGRDRAATMAVPPRRTGGEERGEGRTQRAARSERFLRGHATAHRGRPHTTERREHSVRVSFHEVTRVA
jgi:hypothetical protein